MDTSAISATTRISQARPGALETIAIGGRIAGTLDGLDAVVYGKVAMGISAGLIFRNSASGLLGMSAFSGGRLAGVLGLALHSSIALGAATVFHLTSRRWKLLVQKPWIFGPAFGVAVHIVMHYRVVPGSAVPPRRSPMGWAEFLNLRFAHLVFVGLPMAWAATKTASRNSPRSRAGRFLLELHCAPP